MRQLSETPRVLTGVWMQACGECRGGGGSGHRWRENGEGVGVMGGGVNVGRE